MKSENVFLHLLSDVKEEYCRYLQWDITKAVNDGANTITIGMSSNGGDTRLGRVMFNFLMGLQESRGVEIHTHNMGYIDSAALSVFLAGSKRFACQSSTFLLHPPSFSFVEGKYSRAILSERLSVLAADEEMIVTLVASRTNMAESEVRDRMRARVVISADEALSLGIIDEVKMYLPPLGATMAAVGFYDQ